MSAGRRPSADSTHSEPASGRHNVSSELEQQQKPSGGISHPLPFKIKRRKHLSVSDDPSSKNQLFYFVDSNSSSREKRAHVMRHHVQEKRKQRKHSHPRIDHDRITGRPLRYLPWQQKKLVLDDDAYDDEDDEAMGPQKSPDGTILENNSLVAAGFPEFKSASNLTEESQPTSPVTLLDASRKDPFDTLPIVCSREDLELADYWTNKLTYWSGQNKYIKNKVFRAAMGHPLAFQAVILTYCARWKVQLYNLKESKEADTQVERARKGIEDAMKGSADIDGDSLTMALTGMALQEDRFGSKQEARNYLDQANQVLRSRPGSSSTIEVFFHYVRFIIMPQDPEADGERHQWLVTFLRAAEALMLEHSTPAYISSVPQRCSAFRMDSPLFPLLSSGPRPSQVPQDSRMYVVRDAPTQEVTRTAALLYIQGVLYDLQDSPSKIGRFLNYITAMAKEHKLDRYPACETFIWLLLEEGCDFDLREPQRAWSTAELLKKHNQLRPDFQFHFNEILFSCLMLMPPIRGVDAFEQEVGSSSPDESDDLF